MSESPFQGPFPPESGKDGSSGRHARPPREEFRKHMRFQVDDASAKLYLKGLLTSIGLGRVNKGRAAINLSERGVLLLVSEQIPVGTRVVVRIEMARSAEAIDAEGVVRWCSGRGGGKDPFHAGVEFSALGDEALKRIAQMRERVSSPARS